MPPTTGRQTLLGNCLGDGHLSAAALYLRLQPHASDTAPVSSGPVVYLNFNEGSSNLALDASGHGNTGTIHGSAFRVDNDGCVKALVLDGNASYVSISYTPANHPADAITVSHGSM